MDSLMWWKYNGNNHASKDRSNMESEPGAAKTPSPTPNDTDDSTTAPPPPPVEAGHRGRRHRTLPLSMQLMRHVSGVCYCSCNCVKDNDGFENEYQFSTNKHNDDDDDGVPENATAAAADLVRDYDLAALRAQNSFASPLVVGPMMMMTTTTTTTATSSLQNPSAIATVDEIIAQYITACKFYGCEDRINAGILTTIRFSLPCLRVSADFHDADMLPLAEIMLRHMNGPLRYIKRLDFSIPSKEGKLHGRAGFRSHGAFTLSKILQSSEYIEEVYLQRNLIGPFGAAALFIACSENTSLKKLVMRRCRIGERGALAFAELISNNSLSSSSQCAVEEVDLSANFIGFRGSVAIENAIVQRSKDPKLRPIIIDLEGNLVLQEVMNGVTHGLGILLVCLGAVLLSKRVQDKSHRHLVSCAVYSTSLFVLYTSSTLYHSFFTMRHTKWIFAVMDKCAIYILISGSYTPFLQILLWHEPLWSVYLLTFIWSCCFFGICVEAFLPTWKYRPVFSLAMYLGMGWSALVCLPEVARLLPESAINLMVLGGVGYTAGVPFFVRNNNLDHAIWHLFVLAGSIFHWCGIYFYVAVQD